MNIIFPGHELANGRVTSPVATRKSTQADGLLLTLLGALKVVPFLQESESPAIIVCSILVGELAYLEMKKFSPTELIALPIPELLQRIFNAVAPAP